MNPEATKAQQALEALERRLVEVITLEVKAGGMEEWCRAVMTIQNAIMTQHQIIELG